MQSPHCEATGLAISISSIRSTNVRGCGRDPAALCPPRRRVGVHAAEDSATPKRVQTVSTKSTTKRVKKLCSCVSVMASSSKRKFDFFALTASRIDE